MKADIKDKNFVFLLILIIINLGLAIYATPITGIGDSQDYINMTRFLFGDDISMLYLRRSPLYPIILSVFIGLFNKSIAIEIVVIFQYFLVALTTWMVFKIFKQVFQRIKLAIITALSFNFSFATIYYANIILTEILTVFIFLLVVTLLMWIYKTNKTKGYFALGFMIGLLLLARYNTFPLIITFGGLLLVDLFQKRVPIKKYAYAIGAYLISFTLVINIWCLYNYERYGFYDIFPNSGVSIVSRNILVASIRPENIVTEDNKPILDIFIDARKTHYQQETKLNKGSMMKADKYDFLNSLYAGYSIYQIAIPNLMTYYKLDTNKGTIELSSKLGGFFEEIASQNKFFFIKCRMFSLISSMRASAGGGLPEEYGSVNLNILPGFIFIFYKISIFIISLFFFISFIFYFIRIVWNRFRFDIIILSLYVIALSFWLTNVLFITANDANRFKFPAEPLIFGLFVFFVFEVYKFGKKVLFHQSNTKAKLIKYNK
jgi:4-amino-4-deoxy-L-arabinose transferase-like glycosyltransferase